MHALTLFSDAMLTHLLWASVQAAVLVGLIWLVCRLLPRLPATVRSALWWLVAAQLLIGLAWPVPVRLPVLTPAPAAVVVEHTTSALPVERTSLQRVAAAIPSHSAPLPSNATTTVVTAPLPWRQALIALWLVGLLVQLVFIGKQWRRARYLRRTSQPAQDPQWLALCERLSRELGLRVDPELRISDAVQSLQVSGLSHPVVLLSAKHALTPEEYAMALAHELAHLRRGDLWWGWAPIAARTLFFFHPLVHVAIREYALNREAACDSLALRLHSTMPQAYGKLLLRLGVERPMPVGLAGMASPSFRHLKRRLTMLQQAANLPRTHDWLLVAVVALAFVVPYRAVAARNSMSSAHGQPTSKFAANHPLPLPPSPPAPPSLPATPASPLPPATAETNHFNFSFNGSNVNIDTTSSTQESMALFTNNVAVDTTPNARNGIGLFTKDSAVIAGTQADLATAKRLYQASQVPMLWFRNGGKAYVTHDLAVILKAQIAYAGALAAGRASARLNAQKWGIKGPLDGLQSRYRSILNRVHVLQADPTAPAQHERLTSLERQKRTATARIAALQRQLVAFHPKEAVMARRVQQATTDADLKVERIIEKAVADGKAQPATA